MKILDLSIKLAELEEKAIRMKDDIHFGNLCRQDVTSLEKLIEMLDQLKLPWEKREHSVAHDGCDPIFLQRGLWEFVTCEEPFKRGSKEGGWEVKQWAVRTRPDSRFLIITEEVLPEDPHFYGWPLIITRIEEDRVTAAVARTKALMPEYWQKTLVERAGLSSEAVGSSYSGLTPAELE
ncbi:MAG: hypothetical protein KKH11_01250, partial [Candidatus Omnitrophica bacterium]|nr:hypothetical protein [Candidatus Omnitrophota bacterium]